jgi:hypothetical protein
MPVPSVSKATAATIINGRYRLIKTGRRDGDHSILAASKRLSSTSETTTIVE